MLCKLVGEHLELKNSCEDIIRDTLLLPAYWSSSIEVLVMFINQMIKPCIQQIYLYENSYMWPLRCISFIAMHVPHFNFSSYGPRAQVQQEETASMLEYQTHKTIKFVARCIYFPSPFLRPFWSEHVRLSLSIILILLVWMIESDLRGLGKIGSFS